MSITLNTGTAATRMGKIESTGLLNFVKGLDTNKDNIITGSEIPISSQINFTGDGLTGLAQDQINDLRNVIVAQLENLQITNRYSMTEFENTLEIQSGGVPFPIDNGGLHINTTMSNLLKFSLVGNPVVVVNNPYPGTRTPMFTYKNSNNINVNFTDVSVLPRELASSYGYPELNDNQQLVEVDRYKYSPNFNKQLESTYSQATDSLAIKLKSPNERVNLHLQSSPDLQNWTTVTNPSQQMTYTNNSDPNLRFYSVTIPLNGNKSGFFRTGEDLQPISLPATWTPRLQKNSTNL